MDAQIARRALHQLGVADPDVLEPVQAQHETDVAVFSAAIDEERIEIWMGHPESPRAAVAHFGAAASMLEFAGLRAPVAFRITDVDGIRAAVRSPRRGSPALPDPEHYRALGRCLAALPTYDRAGIDVESGAFRPLSYPVFLNELVDRGEASVRSAGLQRHPAFDALCQAFRTRSMRATLPGSFQLVLPDLQPANLYVEDGELSEIGGLSSSLMAAPAFQWGAALHLPRACSLALLEGAGVGSLRGQADDLALGFIGRVLHQCSVWAALARRASPWERATLAHLIASASAETLTGAPEFLNLESQAFTVASPHWFRIAELASSLPRPGRREIELVALAVGLLDLDRPEDARRVLHAIGSRLPATPPTTREDGEPLTAHLARRATSALGVGFEAVVAAIGGWNTHSAPADTPIEHLGALALRAWGETLGADELDALSEHWDAASWRAPEPVAMPRALAEAARGTDPLALPRLLGLQALDPDRFDIPGITAALLTL